MKIDIISLSLKDYHILSIDVELVVAIIVLAYVIFRLFFHRRILNKSVMVEEVNLGIGNSSVKLKVDRKDIEIAYKLWVELNTRKIGLPYDIENDVLNEVYDSWYGFFGVARELMKELRPRSRMLDSQLVGLTGEVLNKGLRPHLTKWQARFRKWYAENYNLDINIGKSPQEIQKDYPKYQELIDDLIATNEHMMEYKKVLQKVIQSGSLFSEIS